MQHTRIAHKAFQMMFRYNDALITNGRQGTGKGDDECREFTDKRVASIMRIGYTVAKYSKVSCHLRITTTGEHHEEHHHMKDKNAPMTDGQFQTLHNLMRKIDGKLDNFQGDISQIKRDMKVISETLMLERDSKGQLRKAS